MRLDEHGADGWLVAHGRRIPDPALRAEVEDDFGCATRATEGLVALTSLGEIVSG